METRPPVQSSAKSRRRRTESTGRDVSALRGRARCPARARCRARRFPAPPRVGRASPACCRRRGLAPGASGCACALRGRHVPRDAHARGRASTTTPARRTLRRRRADRCGDGSVPRAVHFGRRVGARRGLRLPIPCHERAAQRRLHEVVGEEHLPMLLQPCAHRVRFAPQRALLEHVGDPLGGVRMLVA